MGIKPATFWSTMRRSNYWATQTHVDTCNDTKLPHASCRVWYSCRSGTISFHIKWIEEPQSSLPSEGSRVNLRQKLLWENLQMMVIVSDENLIGMSFVTILPLRYYRWYSTDGVAFLWKQRKTKWLYWIIRDNPHPQCYGTVLSFHFDVNNVIVYRSKQLCKTFGWRMPSSFEMKVYQLPKCIAVFAMRFKVHYF